MEADKLFESIRSDPDKRFSDIEREINIIFSRISTEDLSAMEYGTHHNTPYGRVIADVLTERILIGISHD